MSLGSRIAKRARAAVNANLASTPREPLLFLYPQWSRNSSTSAKPVPEQPVSQQDKRLPIRKTIDDSTLPEPLKLKKTRRVTCRIEESLEKLEADEGDGSKEDDSDFQVRRVLATNATREGTAPEGAEKQLKSSVRRVLATEKPAKEHFMGLGERHKTASELELPPKAKFISTSRLGEPILQNYSVHEPVFIPRTVIPKKERLKRRVRRILEKNSRLEESARINSETDSAYKNHLREMREELKDPWVVDWRDILSDLKKYTPSHGPWLERALRITVPEASMADLVHAIDGHLWDIGTNYGCSVNMDTGDEGKKGRSFLISGSLVALGKFTADVIRVAPKVKIFSAGANGDSADLYEQDDGLVNTTVRFKPTGTPKVDWRLAPDKIPRPHIWTPDTFLEYVRAITNSSISNHIKMTDREDNDPDLRVLYVSMVSDLFSNPECMPHVTKAACHEALQFFLDANMIKDLRILFVRMSMLEIEMDVETFNIMLRGAAKSRNLAAFHFILHLMLNRGFIPNPRTWLAFLEAHSNMEIRIHVINGMKERGLLRNKAVVKGICFGITKYEIEASLDNQQSQEEFIAHMDARYTPFWLSKGSGSRILDALGSRGLISRCWEFLHFMHSRNIDPNTACINTILFHCKEQRNFTGAIEVLRALPPTRKYVPNEETFDRLFFMAWESQNYNMVRVIWRYACLYAATSATMRHRMFRSLQVATKSKEPEAGRARFRQLVGPVVFGNSWQGTHPVQFSNKLAVRDGSLGDDPSKHGIDKSMGHGKNEMTSDFKLGAIADSEFQIQDSSDDQPTRPLLRRVGGKKRDATGQPIEPRELKWVFVPTDLDGSSLTPEDPEPDDLQTIDTSPTDVSQQSNNPEAHISLLLPDHGATFDYRYLSQPESQARDPNSPLTQVSKNREYRRKIRFLHQLAQLDHLVYKKWEPVKPMSVMLVEAAERDKEWRRRKWLAKQKGEVPSTERDFMLERDRMIEDCVEVEVRTRDGMFDKAWK